MNFRLFPSFTHEEMYKVILDRITLLRVKPTLKKKEIILDRQGPVSCFVNIQVTYVVEEINENVCRQIKNNRKLKDQHTTSVAET